ncbi:ABC transporter ATP-binding protein [Hufsiella ginkgonis]|uniref:ATP-binding cassette domain-containing protein n=1 Tax=Hufsiella ginkgonis TaxID=2695274 RepID=A0A7K1Y292_9SPHI|nr:ABC transporter ATP-binding protein [Hufsiella ginkgonis]MXV17188.1 ATP-binding cassette domain-containing protein [Hufsiella ginkgonis]
MSPVPFLELKQVTRQYMNNLVSGVREISVDISQGQVIAVVGESGSGKSTLLKLIYGLVSPQSGQVLFKGEVVMGPEEKLIPGHDRMKMVTQDFDLNTYAKVYDNIASMLPNTNLEKKRNRSLAMMELLHIGHLADKRVADLSGGERQRVAIARAMITEPEVLLMDEPFSQLDTLVKNILRADIKRLAQETGVTIILVSHDPVDGLMLAEQLIILREGAVIETGTPSNVYNQPKHPYTGELLGSANVLSPGEATAIGLKAKGSQVLFYPEWVSLNAGWTNRSALIEDVSFKGAQEEVRLLCNGTSFRALCNDPGKYQKGMKVHFTVRQVTEF